MSKDSHETLEEIKTLSEEIKSKRKNLWTNLEGMLNDGFTGIDDRGKLYKQTEGNLTYGKIIEDYVADKKIPDDFDSIKKKLEKINNLSTNLQTQYQKLQNSREAHPVLPTQRDSDYQFPTTPYSANPIRTAISPNP